MPDTITTLYLILMFISLYMFAFFIMLTIKNRKALFSYPALHRTPLVSILIPAYNEEDSIEETIAHVMALDYDHNKLEVIVLNDGSKDKTSSIVKRLLKKYSNLKLIDKENSGKAKSLNIGVAQCKGELVAVVDSDSFPSKGSLRKLVGFFEDPLMGAVTSFVRVRNYEHNFLARIQGIEYLIMGWTRKLLDFVDSVYVTNGPLSLYRKEYIRKVGGFDHTTVTEDIDITWNMLSHGYRTSMCMDASVTTIAPHKFGSWFKQRTRWGLGGLQAIVKYRKLFFRKGMFGAFILPFVSISILLSLFTFIFSSYLLFKFFLTKFLAAGYSISSNVAIFTMSDVNLYPSVLLFYFFIIFTLSLTYSSYILFKTDYEGIRRSFGVKRLFTILFYMFFYLTLYPAVWFTSIYRYLRRDNTW